MSSCGTGLLNDLSFVSILLQRRRRLVTPLRSHSDSCFVESHQMTLQLSNFLTLIWPSFEDLRRKVAMIVMRPHANQNEVIKRLIPEELSGWLQCSLQMSDAWEARFDFIQTLFGDVTMQYSWWFCYRVPNVIIWDITRWFHCKIPIDLSQSKSQWFLFEITKWWSAESNNETIERYHILVL